MNEINDKVSTLTELASPVIGAKEQYQRGMHVIGVLGAFCIRAGAFVSRWVRRAVKVGLTVLAVWLFYRALLSGHTFSDALEIASKALK